MSETIDGSRVVLVDEAVTLTRPVEDVPTPDNTHYLNTLGGHREVYPILETYAKAKRDGRIDYAADAAHGLFLHVLGFCDRGFQRRMERILSGSRRYEVTIRCEFEFDSDEGKSAYDFESDLRIALENATATNSDFGDPWFDVEVYEKEG